MKFAAFTWVCGLSGCLVIPTPEHALLEGRGGIDQAAVAFLSVGRTTREEVVLRFGEPDLVLHGGRILIYHWSVSHGYWFLAGGYTAAGGPVPKSYLFMIGFDDGGRLARYELGGSIWTSEQRRIDKWTPIGSEKLAALHREKLVIDPAPAVPAQAYGMVFGMVPTRFQIGEFSDGRPGARADNFVGYKKAALDVILADVATCRPATDTLRATVLRQLELMGLRLVEKEADVVVAARIVDFGVSTSVGLASWDAVGSLEVQVEVERASGPADKITRRYASRHVARTFSGPSGKDFEQVLRSCLEDLQLQLSSDAELAGFLRRAVP